MITADQFVLRLLRQLKKWRLTHRRILFGSLVWLAVSLQQNGLKATAADTHKGPTSASAYAGDEACRTCHTQSIKYDATAHHLTSQLPAAGSVKGSFTTGENVLRTANPGLTFEMDAVDSRFLETARYVTRSSQVQTLTQPIDLVIGSGRKGNTYLYWNGDDLFELPVSYWTATRSWINSPGYQDGTAHFDRPIAPQCLECHSSYFESLAPPVNRFARGSLILGITCERCHGAGLEHVVRERSAKPPRGGSAEIAIVNPRRLPRDRQIDLCSLCHAGPITPLAPALSFQPGDKLDEYVKVPELAPDAPLDVHTNQVQLLKRSRCYQGSGMTCSTCHNVHEEQRDVASFSARCLTCHKVQSCGEYPRLHAQIRSRCVSCHMPLQSSAVLFSDSNGQRLNPQIRNHRIAIYPEQPRADAHP